MNSSFDFSDGLFAYLWWMIPVAAAAFLAQTRWLKNFAARFAVNVRAKCELDAGVYHAFPKLDVRLGGRHEQIDCVYVSRFGIFVVSTPNQQGRIWGDDGKGMWTQEFHKSQAQFMNPLVQNQRYIEVLAEQLSLSQKVFYSVVVFPKNCRFQTMMPDNVLDTGDFNEFIAQYDEPVLDDETVAAIRAQLETSEFDVVFGSTRLGNQSWPLNSHS
ncbi:nuclease-related domain-containing protein [Neisseria sp. CCUG12390]|uniref:nuclease-related domain-containing protein n=1 Tax=Neisseria sp. CCUG12390 TaxID=3392035 RepID=UPI003A102EFD